MPNFVICPAEEPRLGDECTVHDIITLSSPYAPPDVLDRLAALVAARGMTVFARIEFANDAAAAGLTLAPMAQLVFGNPRSGTPILSSAPLSGLDLPLRALAWTDSIGRSWLSYRDPVDLGLRLALPQSATEALQVIHRLCREAVE